MGRTDAVIDLFSSSMFYGGYRTILERGGGNENLLDERGETWSFILSLGPIFIFPESKSEGM